MKNFTLTLSVLFASALLASCHPKFSDVAAIADTAIVGPKYSANKGLFVPDETRRSLGLKTVEIGDQKLSTTVDLSLRVYAASSPVMRASGSVTAAQAKALKVGQSLAIRTSDGRMGTATITAFCEQVSKATGAVEVVVDIPNSFEAAVGSFLSAKVTLDAGERVATVPRSALIQTIDGYSVYAVSGKHFVRTPVRIGALNADLAEISAGLYSGDQVVSESAMSLWLTELAAVKGGHACCVVPAKGK